MNRRTDAWRNGCLKKVDDHLVCTTPNQHPPKIDVLPKTFLPIILASKWQARHSSTSLKQQRRPLPSLLYISYMLSSHHAYLSEIFKEKCLILWKVDSICNSFTSSDKTSVGDNCPYLILDYFVLPWAAWIAGWLPTALPFHTKRKKKRGLLIWLYISFELFSQLWC